jgi:7,8-dihydroneopterin aldolase/epimerase/oxygenase
MDKLMITDLQFHGHCGLTPAEREAGQRLTVDLEMVYDASKSAGTDSLDGRPDYSEVASAVLEIGRKEQFKLLESLGERMAQLLIKQFPVQEVMVRIKKFHPPVEAIQGYFSVEVRKIAGDG